ncbi:MAG: HutD family protein, partial [Hyphomicrobiales bacterium]
MSAAVVDPSNAFTCERLDPTAYRRTPWKNGGGVTVDIASAYRPGAGAEDWSGVPWRFGRTRIERPGPFSDLSGYDRALGVIEGSGLVLRPAASPPIDVRQPFRPVSFPGEWPIESELESGGVGVLNLITERGSATG